MKYILIIGDGMADNAVPELNGKTPLEVAEKPFPTTKNTPIGFGMFDEEDD